MQRYWRAGNTLWIGDKGYGVAMPDGTYVPQFNEDFDQLMKQANRAGKHEAFVEAAKKALRQYDKTRAVLGNRHYPIDTGSPIDDLMMDALALLPAEEKAEKEPDGITMSRKQLTDLASSLRSAVKALMEQLDEERMKP